MAKEFNGDFTLATGRNAMRPTSPKPLKDTHYILRFAKVVDVGTTKAQYVEQAESVYFRAVDIASYEKMTFIKGYEMQKAIMKVLHDPYFVPEESAPKRGRKPSTNKED